MRNILNKFNQLGKAGIEKLKALRTQVKCCVCHETMNTNEDTNVHHSSSLSGWLHDDCVDDVERCDTCQRLSFHIENGICVRCLDRHSIRSYGYKPYPSFHRIKPNTGKPFHTDNPKSKQGIPINHFGVEIEIDRHENDDGFSPNILLTDNNLASIVGHIGKAVANCRLFYCKEDSSLTSNGVEVVSHPFSWNFWRTIGQDIYDSLFSVLLSSGYFSSETESGGLHIHISKEAINKHTLLKLLWFVYESPVFMEFIAQRSTEYGEVTWNSLTGYYSSVHTFSKKRSLLSKIARLKFSENQARYTAVNLENEATIEFRLFKGTLNIMTLSKAIEFIHSLMAYCSETPISHIVNRFEEPARVELYLKYLSKYQTRYTNLCSFIANNLDMSTYKKKKLFAKSTDKLSRALLKQSSLQNPDNVRQANKFNSDCKGVVV